MCETKSLWMIEHFIKYTGHRHLLAFQLRLVVSLLTRKSLLIWRRLVVKRTRRVAVRWVERRGKRVSPLNQNNLQRYVLIRVQNLFEN